MILLGDEGVPTKLINNQKYMDHILSCWQINMSLPGCIENEHPHRFLKDLR